MSFRKVLALGALLAVVATTGRVADAQAATHQEHEQAEHEGQHQAEGGDDGGHDGAHHEPMGRHRFVIFTGNTFVPAGTTAESQNLVVPTFGIDYSYWPSRKFGFGVAADIEIASYFVETGEAARAETSSSAGGGTGAVKRENAAIVAVLAFWEPVHRLAFFAGPGREFESHDSFWLLRVGTEYAFPIPNQWSIAVTLIYDHKEVYDSWSLGVAFAKRFGKPID